VALRRHDLSGRSRVALALATALALLAQPVAPAARQASAQPGGPQTAQGAAKGAAGSGAAAPAIVDSWPRAYSTPAGSRFMIYQPQIAEWQGQRRMIAYSAVSVEQPGQPKAALGTVKIEADTKVAVDVRMVSFSDMTLTESSFPTLP